MQLLIRNARYYADGKFNSGNILVEDGKIIDILDQVDDQVKADRVIDVNGLYTLPGIIDSHVHIRDPGHTEREDFFTGSTAACAGGITTICEMPISNPPVYNSKILKSRVKRSQGKSMVDICFYGAAGYDNLGDIGGLVEAGAIAFKTFLHPAPEGRDKEFIGLTIGDDGDIYNLMKEGAKHDVRFFFHAENFDIIKAEEKNLEDVMDNSFHYRSRPKISEILSVQTVILLAREFGTKVGVSHVSCPEALELIKKAKSEGVDIKAETCPHYLILDTDYVDEYGAYGKCNPPLRSKEDVKKMWDYVNDGTIDLIGSDHAPFTIEEKEKGKGHIKKAFAGMPGIELMLPLLLNEVNKGNTSLERLASILTESAAKIFGLFPLKGAIEIGADADFAIVDMDAERKISIEKMYTKSRATARLFDDMEYKGSPVYTVSKGNVIMENGIVNKAYKGFGEVVLKKVKQIR